MSRPVLPTTGRLLAIDYGHVRLGLAISDAERRWAGPYANYTRVSAQRDADYLRQVIKDEHVVGLVVGLPVHLDGRESQKSSEARQFAAWLQQITEIPVVLFDERFTTHEAEQHLLSAGLTKRQRRARLDMLAAHALLQAFLEADATADHSQPPALDDRSAP
jgi:putative Holliday junction resolvase